MQDDYVTTRDADYAAGFAAGKAAAIAAMCSPATRWGECVPGSYCDRLFREAADAINSVPLPTRNPVSQE